MSNAESVLAIGTTRRPKVLAVERAIRCIRERCPEFLSGELRLETRRVPSGAPDTPATTEEMMRGAQHRARAVRDVLRGEGLAPGLALGLEGGIRLEDGWPFLESWTYVTDGERGAFGSSGCIPLPRALVEAVEAGAELGAAADAFFRRSEVASHEGTFGLLTRQLVSREDAFVRSLLHAFAPFYNAGAYALKTDPASG